MESLFLSLDSGISGDFYWFFPFLYFMIFLPKKKKKESLSVVIQSNDSSYL